MVKVIVRLRVRVSGGVWVRVRFRIIVTNDG